MVEKGVKDVVALESKISRINGEEGRLEYRGYDIHDLAKNSTYEEVVFLLWHGYLPTAEELEEFSNDLAERREIPPEVIAILTDIPKITHPMVALRTAISYLGSLDEKLHLIEPEENLEKSKGLLAKLPTVIAYCHRIREGKSLAHPDKELGHAANFLWMLKGKEPEDLEVKTLDTDLILHAEHTLNASTYSSRIAASTLSDMYAGIVAATGVLMGPLHGGASQGAIKMLREIKEGNVDPKVWAKEKLKAGKRIMGFGHRVYEVMDPRAKELKRLARKLDKVKDNNWSALTQEVEEVMMEERGLHPNVDLYAASVYANLGIPDEFFTNIFAMSRIAGGQHT